MIEFFLSEAIDERNLLEDTFRSAFFHQKLSFDQSFFRIKQHGEPI